MYKNRWVNWLTKDKPKVFKNEIPKEYRKEIWDIKPARNPNHPAPFPELIPEFEFLKPYSNVISPSELFICITTAVVMFLLTFLIKFTKIGKAMRATAQDKTMAMLLGIDVNLVISVTFIVGSATAAIGGVLIASHIGQINFYMGFIAGIKAFVAAVLGGIGSIPGAVLGSLILGWTESFFTGYISSDYEDAFAFLFLVLILIFRPSGILGKKEY